MLLRVRRAAVRAHAGADAAADVAAHEVARPPERVRAALGDVRVGARQLRRHRDDVERLLHAREVRRERLGREVLEPELVAPAREHVVGRAEAGAGVDERRAADRLPEREQDRRPPERRVLRGVAVELGEHVARAGGELRGGVLRALLEQHDARAGLGELLRHHRAAGARADDARRPPAPRARR